ncbi:MAG: pyridoxal-phosphate dependent enzyme [Prevotellaceae bacterium]|nr:pyridoxal-phosphate dependent enzyme [Candidatus Faecinaster equi]
MNHLPFIQTPITPLPYFSKKYGVNLLCKRDDLFAEAGGGNKARMLQYILYGVTSDKYDVVVTAGNPCSNFNRACALMCAKLGVQLHIVEYSEHEEDFGFSANRKMCEWASTSFTRCEKSAVKVTIDRVVAQYQYQGKRVKFIYGGGRSIEGLYAYYDAVRELSEQVHDLDYIFAPCGTGTTCVGISVGLHAFMPNTQLIGISISRDIRSELSILQEDLDMLNDVLKTNYDFSNFTFNDSYLCGGYNQTNDALICTIKECISQEGLIIDSCYSGKGFYGMSQELEIFNEQYIGKKVLFWNTGGLFNIINAR